MHACGHDTHVAILLRFSTILAAIKNYLQDSVKFIFQPAEEKKGEQISCSVKLPMKTRDLMWLGNCICHQTGLEKAAIFQEMICIFDYSHKSDHRFLPWEDVDPVVVDGRSSQDYKPLPAVNLTLPPHLPLSQWVQSMAECTEALFPMRLSYPVRSAHFRRISIRI